jgi:hypothetical protein
MSDWVWRACATTLLLAAVLTFVPLLLPPDDNGLPTFNDDDSGETPPAFFQGGVVTFSSLAPLLGVPDRCVSIVEASEARRIEAIPRKPLSSRSPPFA